MLYIWRSASTAIIGPDKSNDYTYKYSNIFSTTFERSPIVISDWVNASATLGIYANVHLCTKSVDEEQVTVTVYNANSTSVQVLIRIIAIRRDFQQF